MKKITLFKTSTACPEQYDVLDEKGKYVGYIRFRFGQLEVHPVIDNEPKWNTTLLEKSVNDDLLGIIPDSVKKEWLEESKKVILNYWNNESNV